MLDELKEDVRQQRMRLGQMDGDLRVLTQQVTNLTGDVSKVSTGVEELVRRELARPEPKTFRGIAGTLAASVAVLAALAAFTWWFVAASPDMEAMRQADRDLARRLDRLDDPELGRVARIEREFGRWAPSVVRGP